MVEIYNPIKISYSGISNSNNKSYVPSVNVAVKSDLENPGIKLNP